MNLISIWSIYSTNGLGSVGLFKCVLIELLLKWKICAYVYSCQALFLMSSVMSPNCHPRNSEIIEWIWMNVPRQRPWTELDKKQLSILFGLFDNM